MRRIIAYFRELLATLKSIDKHLADIAGATRKCKYGGRYMNTDQYK